ASAHRRSDGGTPYTGKEKDEETGLYYHGARYYAPWLGRWTAADPLVLDQPQQIGSNPFSYVRNSPVSLVDSTGLQEERPFHPAPAPPVSPPSPPPPRAPPPPK